MFGKFFIKKILPFSIVMISSVSIASQNPFVKPEIKSDKEHGSEQQRNVEVKDIDLKSLDKNIIRQDEPVEVELFTINGSTLYKNKQDSKYRIN